MTFQTFRELLKQQPFQPFRLTMSSGVAYEVHRPEMAFVAQKDILVGIGDSGDGIADSFKICPLIQVTAVEPLNDPQVLLTSSSPNSSPGFKVLVLP